MLEHSDYHSTLTGLTALHCRIGGMLALVVATACAGAPPASPPAPTASATSCDIVAPLANAPDTIRIALTDPVMVGRAEGPVNFSEALLGAHLYESLVRLDCTGVLQPGLAVAWLRESERWAFRVRSDALLWDGAPLTAAMVVSAWPLPRDEWLPTVSADGRVTVRVPDGSSLDALAQPRAAIRIGGPGGGIPMGSGPYGIAGLRPDGILVAPAGGSRSPVLAFRRVAGADLRDVLDGGTDMLVTDVPAVADYAAGLQGFDVVALPWDRTYVFASSAWVSGTALADERVALARDVVPAAARPADPAEWPSAVAECKAVAPASGRAEADSSLHILYDRDDPIGRSLAERIVALSADRRLTGLGVSREDLLARLADGRDQGYLVAVLRRLADPCTVQALERVGAVPLIDVRRTLIVRRGIAHIAVDGFGIPAVRLR